MESHHFKGRTGTWFLFFERWVALRSVLEISVFVTTFYFEWLWSCYAKISNELRCFIGHNEILTITFCPHIPIERTAALQSSLLITPFHWHLPFLKTLEKIKLKLCYMLLPIRNHGALKLQKEKNPSLVPESKSHSLPNGRSRGDLAPARLPDPPGLPVLRLGALSFSGLPCGAATHCSRHQNGLTRLEGKGSCSYSHSLLFVFNGKWQLHHCIPQTPGRRDTGCAGTTGWGAVQVPPPLPLHMGFKQLCNGQ